jgi:23S rRNA pseudouridine1911/1915/1917 synthase
MIAVDVAAALDGERIDRAVALLTGLSRAQVTDLVAAGAVSVDGRPVLTRSVRVRTGQGLTVACEDTGTASGPQPDPSIAVHTVYEDPDLLVIDKPAGLVVHPGSGTPAGTLVNGLLARYPELVGVGEDPARPGIVHRLDRGTSGLLVVARSPEAFGSLVDMLAAHEVERRYEALVWGEVAEGSGVIDAPLGRSAHDPTRRALRHDGKQARTQYRVLERFTEPVELTLLECRLETGRTHQIRVHLQAIGHAVVGDATYGGARPHVVLDRPFLHAAALAFDHPLTGEPLRFTSPLPADLAAVLRDAAERSAR